MNKKLIFYFLAMGSIINGMEIQSIQLEKTVISGEGFETTLRDTPKTIYIVTSEEIKNSGAQNISEALKLVPGVKISEGYDGTGLVDIRGQGKQYERNTAILIDGIKMNPIEMTRFDLTSVDINNVKKIEVIPGNASVIYGDNTVGGAINIITKNGDFKDFLIFRGESGSNNTFKRGVAFSSAIENTNVFGNYSKRTSDGYRDNQRYSIDNVELGVKQIINEKNDILIKYNYLKSDKRLPGKLSQSQYEEDKTQSSTPNDWTSNESNRFTGAYTFKNKNFEVINQINYYKNNYYSNSSTFDGKVTDDFSNNFKVKYIKGKNKLISGVDYFTGKTKVEKKDTWAKKEGYGIFLSNSYDLTEKLSIQGGLRRQETEFSYSVKEKKKDFTIDVYDASLNYKYSDTGSIYLSFGKDFRTPLTNEILASNGYLNKEIEPQEGYNIEIGGNDFIYNTFISSALFYKKINDEIYLDVDNKNGGNWGTNTNYDGKSEKIGYELLIEKSLTERLTLTGSYSYLYAKFISGDYKDKYIPGVSKNKFALELAYAPIDILNINLIGNYVGSSFAISDENNENEKVDSYITLDLNINYKVNKDLDVYFGVKNLTNEEYNESVQELTWGRFYYPATERRYYAGFTYKMF